MDFMRIIKSLEELLYELMVWLVFYPRTLWQAIVRPHTLMVYAHDELDDKDENRYSDTLSPPIFLAITLGLTHALELALGQSVVIGSLIRDDQTLIAFRMVVYALFPLLLSLRLLRARGTPLDRKTLRGPFYAQCFAAAPLALGLGLGTVAVSYGAPRIVATAISFGTILWYVAIQARWFMTELNQGVVRALINAIRAIALGVAILAVVALAIYAM